MITTTTPWNVWLRVGQSTFRSSAYDSRTNCPRCLSVLRPVCCLTGCCDGRTCCARDRREVGAASPAAARAARRCLRVSRATALPRLPVHRVLPAPAAVLVELDPVGGVPLGLLRLVVAPLAFVARKRDRDSYSGGHSSARFELGRKTKEGV